MVAPEVTTPFSSRWAMLIWMLEWSLQPMMRLVQELCAADAFVSLPRSKSTGPDRSART